MAQNIRNRAVAALPLVLLASLALAGCAPSWQSRADALLDAKDFDGAYAVAAEAQAANTSPQNYVAAYTAGYAAYRAKRYELAEEHLRFATSAEATNPARIRYLSWMALGFTKAGLATAQLTADPGPGGASPSEHLAANCRRASATWGDADAALAMAIEFAAKAGDTDTVDTAKRWRAGMRLVRDNMAALGELSGIVDAVRSGESAGIDAVMRAMRTRLDATLAAMSDLCDSCTTKQAGDAVDPGEAPGSGETPTAQAPPVS